MKICPSRVALQQHTSPLQEVDLEAMIGGAPDAFVKQVKGWLALKK